MAVEQQFASFLVDRLSVHLRDIKTVGKESPQVIKATSEMELHLAELTKLISALFDGRRGGNRRGGDANV